MQTYGSKGAKEKNVEYSFVLGILSLYFVEPLAGSAVLCCSAMQRQPVTGSPGKPEATRATPKMRLISSFSMRMVSDIKLIRTDTTLDLSQKAEKV